MQNQGLVSAGLGDARKHAAWGVLIPRKVNWLFQDVAQSGQVDIFIAACKRFLAVGERDYYRLKPLVKGGQGKVKTFYLPMLEKNSQFPVLR